MKFVKCYCVWTLLLIIYIIMHFATLSIYNFTKAWNYMQSQVKIGNLRMWVYNTITHKYIYYTNIQTGAVM